MKTDTRVSFYLVLVILIMMMTMMHPTIGSVLVGGVIAGLLFVLRWRSQEEGRAEVEHLIETVRRDDELKAQQKVAG